MKLAASVTRYFAILLLTIGYASAADLSGSITLVATPRLASSGLSETVLFARALPNGMHVGFVVNRPSDVTVAAAFPDQAPAQKVIDPIYLGGPVLPEMVFAVVRTPPHGAEKPMELMPGVVLVMDAPGIDRIIETAPNEARYFAGLFLWEPGELDEEVRGGAWEVRPADAGAVFSPHPEELWKTLSEKLLETRAGAQSFRG